MGICFLQCRCVADSSWCVLILSFVSLGPHTTRIAPFVTGQSTLTMHTAISITVNALVILSTIHSQDFRDQQGDKRAGRWTIPMVWPEGSRISILVILVAWSIGLSWACGLDLFSMPFCALAVFIGLRFFRERTADEDKQSFHYYTVRYHFTVTRTFHH